MPTNKTISDFRYVPEYERLELYCLRPREYGELSFFVMAKSKTSAYNAINKRIKDDRGESAAELDLSLYYPIQVVGEGEVIVHDNG